MTSISTARSMPRPGSFWTRIGHRHWPRMASGDGQWRNGYLRPSGIAATETRISLAVFECPRQDSNLRSRLRRPLLSPLSYWGSGLRKITSPGGPLGPSAYGATRPRGCPLPPVSAEIMPGCLTAGRVCRSASTGNHGPAIPDPTSAFPARSVAGTAGKTLPSRPWRRDWDACSWWTTMR